MNYWNLHTQYSTHAYMQHFVLVPQCLKIEKIFIVFQRGKFFQLLVSISLYNAVMTNIFWFYKYVCLTNSVNFRYCFSEIYKCMHLIIRVHGTRVFHHELKFQLEEQGCGTFSTYSLYLLMIICSITLSFNNSLN